MRSWAGWFYKLGNGKATQHRLDFENDVPWDLIANYVSCYIEQAIENGWIFIDGDGAFYTDEEEE